MKKIFILLLSIIHFGCYYVEPYQETETRYYYKRPVVRKVIEMQNADDIVYGLGGFRNLEYKGKVVAETPCEDFMFVSCYRRRKITQYKIDFRDAVIFLDRPTAPMEDRYMFVHRGSNFPCYLFLTKSSTPFTGNITLREIERLEQE